MASGDLEKRIGDTLQKVVQARSFDGMFALLKEWEDDVPEVCEMIDQRLMHLYDTTVDMKTIKRAIQNHGARVDWAWQNAQRFGMNNDESSECRSIPTKEFTLEIEFNGDAPGQFEDSNMIASWFDEQYGDNQHENAA